MKKNYDGFYLDELEIIIILETTHSSYIILGCQIWEKYRLHNIIFKIKNYRLNGRFWLLIKWMKSSQWRWNCPIKSKWWHLLYLRDTFWLV